MARMLSPLPHRGRAQLVEAMGRIEALLGARRRTAADVTLRAPRPGELGWVVERHGALYASEYGFDQRFEALVAGIVKEFVERFDPGKERCWIAELDGAPAGSAFVVRKSKRTAKLRLLIVDPAARGMGLGRRLVEACIDFARASGYRKLVLWTQANLTAARAIYRKLGFVRRRTERHASFGPPLVGEYWELAL